MRFLGRQLRTGTSTRRASPATILSSGTVVGTPSGPGTVDRIELGLIQVDDHVELDVPHVFVRLEGSSEIVQVCLCKLELPDQAAQEALRKEYERLWPPLPESAGALPKELAASLQEALNHDVKTVAVAAQLLKRSSRSRHLLRAATTVAVLQNPDNQIVFERAEAAVLRQLER